MNTSDPEEEEEEEEEEGEKEDNLESASAMMKSKRAGKRKASSGEGLKAASSSSSSIEGFEGLDDLLGEVYMPPSISCQPPQMITSLEEDEEMRQLMTPSDGGDKDNGGDCDNGNPNNGSNGGGGGDQPLWNELSTTSNKSDWHSDPSQCSVRLLFREILISLATNTFLNLSETYTIF